MKAMPMKSLPLALGLALFGCSSKSEPDGPDLSGNQQEFAVFDPAQPYAPNVMPGALSAEITNPLSPAPVGAKWTYEAVTDEGLERIEISVEAATQQVWGVAARVVRDTAYRDDVMIEDTWDWFGQDGDGNIWYLGEDTSEYENGAVVSTLGSWEAGVRGALPGVVMLASPQVGDVYRQEYLTGEAEDYALVVSMDSRVSVRAGTFTNCLKTRDLSAIDPELDEFKYYCPNVGLTLVEEDEVREELVSYSGL
jgi:hypothetical protein